MTSVTWTQVHRKKHLISRVWYRTPGSTAIVAPAGAAYVRVSMVGAGKEKTGSAGDGAAFARSTTSGITPGEGFTVQVGDKASAGSAAGDSIFTRTTGSVVLTKAKSGQNAGPGLASGCVGDVKRDGSAATHSGGEFGGASAGDDADTFPLGFGGPGASQITELAPGGPRSTPAARGAGGGTGLIGYFDPGNSYSVTVDSPAGHGEVCVEFFNRNPNTSWPGYSP